MDYVIQPIKLSQKQLSNTFFYSHLRFPVGFPCGSAGKESACNGEDPSSIPGLGRSPWEGKSYPLKYSGLENSMDCIVHGVAKSQTRLSNFHFTSLQLVINHMLRGCHRTAVPNHFGTRDWFCGRQFFHSLRSGEGLGMIQVHNIYWALYFYY